MLALAIITLNSLPDSLLAVFAAIELAFPRLARTCSVGTQIFVSHP